MNTYLNHTSDIKHHTFLEIPRMLFDGSDSLGANHTVNTTDRKEWSGKPLRRFRIQTIQLHLSGAMDVFSVLQVDTYVSHSSALGSPKQQVAQLSFFPIFSLDNLSGQCLLGSITLQDNTVRKVSHLYQTQKEYRPPLNEAPRSA